MTSSPSVLLPRSVLPQRYAIELTPDLDRFTCTGRETIEVEVHEPVSRIILHAAEMQVASAEVVQHEAVMAPSEIRHDAEAETVTLTLPRPLAAGSARLTLQFSYGLNDTMCGFYRSRYEAGGESRYMVSTQFEATDARRAFPCWDEPALKAEFDVTLVVPADRQALSNMPVVDVTPAGEGRQAVKFATTPIMSTYLVAFAVGEFESIEAATEDGVLVRVYTTPGKRDQGRFALDVAVRSLSFYNGYFGIPYPLPKLDLIAIPDFASGAMENWGLVTYRETALLIDPKNSSAASRQSVAIVVAHELAHQWFGNLVTMEWWTHLWLNEGFASWVEYLAVDHLFPEWDLWTQFIAHDFARALSDDGLRSTHPIEVEVRHPSEISEIFDAISYSKGASIIRMIEAFLGHEIFRQGLHHYLSKYAYRNASTDELWQALEEVSGKPVRAMAACWTLQGGYPVLSFEQIGHNEFSLRQALFLSNGDALTTEESARSWHIPIALRTAGSREATSVLMQDREMALALPMTHDWIKLNAGQVAFLRVNYTGPLWERLRTAVEEGHLGPIDRFAIVSDVFALARAGALPATQLLSVLEAYGGETDYTVWTEVLTRLHALDLLLAGSPAGSGFHVFARDLLWDIAKRLGWEAAPEEPHTQPMLRAQVLWALGRYGDMDTTREAQQRFGQYLKDAASLDPNIRGPVYNLTAAAGDDRAYEALVHLYGEATLQEEKVRYLRALGQFRHHPLLEKALAFSLSDAVRSQDTLAVLGSVGANPIGRELAWEFVKAHWTEITRRYAEGSKLLPYFVSAATQGFVSEEAARDVEAFFERHPAPSARRAIQQSLETIRCNARWLERDRAGMTAWLEHSWSLKDVIAPAGS